MICRMATFPTGIPYIEILIDCTWRDFPTLAEHILKKIHAIDVQNLTKGEAIDCHWYQFTWNGKLFRLIFEEWPHQCVIEKLDAVSDLNELLITLRNIE